MTTAEVRFAAALAYQLPRDSRVKSAVAPEDSYGLDVLLLKKIEHNQRLWHWAHTEESQDEGTRPEPITLPGEEEMRERAEEEARERAAEVAAKLGIKF